MQLKQLTIKDKNTFTRFLSLRKHCLSNYAFENVYVWKKLFDITWSIINESLCIFFEDKIGKFLYIPPLRKNQGLDTVRRAFMVMDNANRNREISRIENVEEEDLDFFKSAGFSYYQKSLEYICKSSELSGLEGLRFKSKRASVNYFIKNNKFEYCPFSLQEHGDDCLLLYREWMNQRKSKFTDKIFQGMLEDNLSVLSALLTDYSRLNYLGRIVKIEGKLKAFTFGFRLSPDTFCVSHEVADLGEKGLAQFIFREFSKELSRFPYINLMDDSGLENLKKVKLSYRPVKQIGSFNITRENGQKP